MSRDTGWLLEHEDHRTGHRWLRAIKYSGEMKGTVEWTEDSNLALRFARRDDAVNFAWLFPEMCTLALITEHVWGEGPTLETVALCDCKSECAGPDTTAKRCRAEECKLETPAVPCIWRAGCDGKANCQEAGCCLGLRSNRGEPG